MKPILLVWLFGCGIPPAGTTHPGGDSGGGTFVCDDKNEDCGPNQCGGEGSKMLPGADCLACHTSGGGGEEEEEGGTFTAAGTAFTDLGGNGKLDGAVVRITDANNAVVELTTNSVGNFYTSKALAFPIDAEIEVDGNVRAMAASVDVGGCNSCHSCTGEAGGKLTKP